MFGVAAILRGDKQVELKPAVADIRAVLHDTCRALVAATKAVDRLGPVDDASDEDESDDVEEKPQSLETGSFFDVIAADEKETLARVVAVDDGASRVVEEAARFVGGWEDSYGHVWERDKDATLAAYAAANHPLATFEHDIQKFKDLAEEIRAETHTKHMLFLRVDCEPLVDAAARHCEQWRALPRASQRPGTCRFVRALRVLRERLGGAARAPAALEQLADKVAMHRRFLTRAKRRTLRSRLFALGTRRWRSSSSAARRATSWRSWRGWTRPGPRSRRCSARRRFRWRSTRRASGTS